MIQDENLKMRKRKRDFRLNPSLFLLSMFILFPLLGEIFLRAAISLNIRCFRNPVLYADYFSDDDYWKLHNNWNKGRNSTRKIPLDPLLGWSPRKHQHNPLGIISDSPYSPDFRKKSILFYGDSFVKGTTSKKKRIPQQLNHLLPEYIVYNYGVGAYGIDQIFLRFKESYPLFKAPTIVFGILTTDLDRCVLSIREAPKPYFIIEDDKLLLQKVSVDSDFSEWLKHNPPDIKSYFLAFTIRAIRIIAAGGDPAELTYKQDEKKQINAQIIEEVVKESREHGLPLLYVIFYTKKGLRKTGWRELFLKEQFRKLSVPYLDTKEILLHHARQEFTDVSDYYASEHMHLNEKGNTIIARAIAEYFNK